MARYQRDHSDEQVDVCFTHDELPRPVADAQPDDLHKLFVASGQRDILGPYVHGEYSIEVAQIQMVAACMARFMQQTAVVYVMELHLADLI